MKKDADYEILDDESRAFLQEPMRRSWLLLIAIALFVVIITLWAALTEIDERTSAPGKVIPSTKVQQIQNLEGGILAEIYVQEGDIVNRGQTLLRLDDTRFASSFHESQIKYYALLAQLARLEAESAHKDAVAFPEILRTQYPSIVGKEQELFRTNTANFDAQMESLRKAYEIAQQQVALTTPLAKEGVISKLEYLKLLKDANDAKGRLKVEEQTWYSKINEKLVETKAEMDSLENNLRGLRDRMTRTVITAPVHGIVQEIKINTIGGVIEPGETIMEIVPLDDKLLIEAKVNPQDIGFIHPGQKANVKVTAYDSTIFGTMDGVVKYISPDAIAESNPKGQESSFYKILVETDTNHLTYHGEKLPIIPGMQVTADILTGKKSVLSYVLKPLFKARQQAFGER